MFNRSELLNKAWADYRRDAKMGWGVRQGEAFNRQHFAYCLRMVWAVAKETAAAAAAKVVVKPAIPVCINPVRAEAIRTELRDMELASDFINWSQRAALGVEFASLHSVAA